MNPDIYHQDTKARRGTGKGLLLLCVFVSLWFISGAAGQLIPTTERPLTINRSTSDLNRAFNAPSGFTLQIKSGAALTLASGSTFNFFGSAVTDASTMRTALALVPGTNVQAYDADLGVIAALADPNADRLLFWDDSAGAYAYLTAGSGLTITGTTITATGTGIASDAIFDAAGDTIYASAADTGARLAIGTAGQAYKVNAGATAPEWGTLGYAGGGTNATTQAAARANLGGLQGGHANGTAVLAATPDWDGQLITAVDTYVGMGYGTGAGNVQGLFSLSGTAGAGTVYPVGTWDFAGNISQQATYISQLRSLTVSSGSLTVTAGNVTISAGVLSVSGANLHSIVTTDAGNVDNVLKIQNLSADHHSTITFHDENDPDPGTAAVGIGNSTASAFLANKFNIITNPPSDNITSDARAIQIGYENDDPGGYIGKRAIYIDPTAQTVTIYGNTSDATVGNVGLSVGATGLVTMPSGITAATGTITLGSGSGVAMLASGVLSADTTPDLGTPSAVNLANGTALPVAGITASTSTALGVGSIELGHATDTTITRVSAGVIAVEGVTISGGSVATDAIWDAKGDLAGGTGANTAARLAVGTNGQVLTADSAETTGLKWATLAGTGDVITTADNAFTGSNTMTRSGGTPLAITKTGPGAGTGLSVTASDVAFGGNVVSFTGNAATFALTATANVLTGNFDLGTAGVRITQDGDGAITFLGMGDGSDEDITFNLDDTANTLAITSGTGLNAITATGFTITASSFVGALTGNASTVTTNANLTGDVTSSGNATTLANVPTAVTGPFAAAICNGRLTLTSATPVLTSSVTGAGTVYFTPYKGDQIGLYTGTAWKLMTFAELSITLSTLSASTAYDVWAYDNAGTVALDTTAWTNETTRATALTTQNGVRVKTGAATRRYLGSIYLDPEKKCHFILGTTADGGESVTVTSASPGVVTWTSHGLSNGQHVIFGGTAVPTGLTAGQVYFVVNQAANTFEVAATPGGTSINTSSTGTAVTVGVNFGRCDFWNENHRVRVKMTVADTTDSWTYSTASFQSVNASTANRVTLFSGVPDEPVEARAYSSSTTNNASTQLRWTGIGLDSTSTPSGITGASGSTSAGGRATSTAEYGDLLTGRHYLQALEKASGTGTTTWYGDNAADGTQTGLTVSWSY